MMIMNMIVVVIHDDDDYYNDIDGDIVDYNDHDDMQRIHQSTFLK